MRVTNEVSGDERQALLADNTARLYSLPGYEDGFAKADLEDAGCGRARVRTY